VYVCLEIGILPRQRTVQKASHSHSGWVELSDSDTAHTRDADDSFNTWDPLSIPAPQPCLTRMITAGSQGTLLLDHTEKAGRDVRRVRGGRLE
jgi:hypothetical protein